ncbi:MAG: DUF4349 domain-containing protein [Anaerolineales bacterium]|nr:DUF4349 domain-containing protein [Chloroflexota bacterium]MBL6979702.1 DUF4349 domain-containing protein [Anaerolineales bacterium]
MTKRILLTLSVLALLLSACAGQYASEPMLVSDDYGGGFASGEAMYEMEEAAVAMEPDSEFRATDSTVTVKRMVIKNATLSIVVVDPAMIMDEIVSMAEEMGGFVVSSNLWQTTLGNGVTVDQANINIRVPAERLDEAMTRIKAGAGEVRSEQISGEDVTSQYTDLQSRLRNLEAAETQLMQIMDDANRTEDVLQVYNNLVSVREQIEVIKGQMQYYEQAAALSSISIDIIADEADQPIQIGGWQPAGVAKDAIEALINALQGLVNFVIWLVIYILPLALVIGFPLTFVWRRLRNWRQKRKEKKLAQQKE